MRYAFVGDRCVSVAYEWTMPEPIVSVQTGFADIPAQVGTEIAMWVLGAVGSAISVFGRWLLQAAPDFALTLAMAFCLGAIANIEGMGRKAAFTTVVAALLEGVRTSTL